MTRRRTTKKEPERRSNATLRELLDELVQHVRQVSQHAREMPREDLEHAQERLEWLADEIWRQVMEQQSGGA